MALPLFTVCNVGFDAVMQGTVYPVLGVAAMLTSITIAAAYAYGEAINNPKATTWAKIEAVQLFVSIAAVILLISIMGSLCNFKFGDVLSITTLGSGISSIDKNLNFYESAHDFLYKSADYSHNVLRIERYIVGGLNMLENRGRWCCSADCGTANEMWCLFGNSGVSSAPFGGAGTSMVALNIAFNSALFSYVSSLNFLFIYLYGISSMMLLLLPLGIFVRSLPFMRSLGSLMLTVAVCFFIVYPALLNLMFVVSDSLTGGFTIPSSLKDYMDETQLSDLSDSDYFDFGPVDQFNEKIFGTANYNFFSDALQVAGKAFFIAVFLPTLALLGTIASIRYIGKMMGEEIDLSRIVQMI